MKETLNKMIVFSTGIAIGYYLGCRKKWSGCNNKDYVINELKLPAYVRTGNLWKYH